MMDCCAADVIEARFDDAYVQKKLAKYRKKGPKKTTAILAGAIAENMEAGMSLLDIGGGIGDLQHILLPQGISQTINCEASSAFLKACDQVAKSRGYDDKITHLQGDFVEIAGEVPEADIVTLDRVICCYPNMPELVQSSLTKARVMYAIVIPSENWLIKSVTSLYYNLRFFFQKNPFRVHIHSVEAIEALIFSSGFRKVFSQSSGGWLISLYTISA